MSEPLKIDLGCGKNKMPGFIGVDSLAFEGVDVVTDLTKRWPWDDNSVDEANSSHFLEHLDQMQRVHFWNELYRVLKPGCVARIVAPHWSHSCAYGDPTHVWPPVSPWAIFYTNKQWRDGNAPHTDHLFKCDFDWSFAGSWDQRHELRNNETKQFAMMNYIDSYRDVIFMVTKPKDRALSQPALEDPAPATTAGD